MQPYVFPYIGYFHLIEATDKIVFYDDVNFIKSGWINRNRILVNGRDHLFTIPLLEPSSFKIIQDTYLHPQQYPLWRKKFLRTILQNYSKAPHFSEVYGLVEKIIDEGYDSISDLSVGSIIGVYKYLGKNINWTKSSSCSLGTKGMPKEDRIIRIAKGLNCTEYINVMGGKELYDKEYFGSRGVKLGFVESQLSKYAQFENHFVAGLSIIDVLMFNDKKSVLQQFSTYRIV